MERDYLLKAFFIGAGFYGLSTVISILGTDIPAPFLLSLICATAYLLYEGVLNLKETVLATGAFTVSGLIIAYAAKKIIYNSLCETSKNLSGQMNSVLTGEQACKSVSDIFFAALKSGPAESWQFWIFAVAASVLSILLYRKYKGTSANTA